jgi:hypothetical protein
MNKPTEEDRASQAIGNLFKLAFDLSDRSRYSLHPSRDDLSPYLSTNEELANYEQLLFDAKISYIELERALLNQYKN